MRQSHICGKPMPPCSTPPLSLRRIAYPQILCITLWTGRPQREKAATQAMTCVNLLDHSPTAESGLSVLPREFAGSIVAVTLLRPVFLLRYSAASATLSSLSGIFFSLDGHLIQTAQAEARGDVDFAVLHVKMREKRRKRAASARRPAPGRSRFPAARSQILRPRCRATQSTPRRSELAGARRIASALHRRPRGQACRSRT